MENNENNVQEQVKKVKKDVPKGNAAKGFVVAALLIVFLGVGFGLGYLFSNGLSPFATKDNNTQTTGNKKIDESKPWVYDAEYLKDKEEKVKKSSYNDTEFKSSEQIKLPYININSEDARIANDEIKVIADKAYVDFGKSIALTNVVTNEVYYDDNCFSYIGYKYNVYENEKVLSVVIEKKKVTVPGDVGSSYLVYNFDLETLKSIDIDTALQYYGFKSKLDFNRKLNTVLNSEESKNKGLSSEYTPWGGERFFVKDNKIYAVVPGPAMSETYVEVPADIVETTSKTETTTNTTTEIKTEDESKQTVTQTPAYATEYLKIIDEVVAKNSSQELNCDLIYFNNDDIPDLVIGLNGYWVSLYIYENGTVYNPVDDWSYGMMGNVGYEYLEKKGIISNHNSDYAGAVSTNSILILNSEKKFDVLSKTGVGAELESTDEMYEEVQKYLEKAAGCSYNANRITEEEYNNKLKELSIDSNTKFKGLVGSKTIEEVKKELQK